MSFAQVLVSKAVGELCGQTTHSPSQTGEVRTPLLPSLALRARFQSLPQRRLRPSSDTERHRGPREGGVGCLAADRRDFTY